MKVKTALMGMASCTLALIGAMPASAAAQNAVDQGDAGTVARDTLVNEAPATSAPAASPGLTGRAAATSALSGTVPVGAIRITGARSLPLSAYAPVIDSYVGRDLDPAALRALAGAVADVARQNGFGLATAWIPPQTVVGRMLEVVVDEGTIDSIEVKGAAERPVARLLAPLVGAGPVTTAAVERRLQLAGDVEGVTIGKSRLDRRGRRNVLVVETRRQNAIGYASLDNWGTDTVGPVRAQASVNILGVAGDDDRLQVGGVVTPFQPREFRLGQLGYAKPIGTSGTILELSGYYAQSKPGGSLRNRQLTSDSVSVSFELSQPLVRTRKSGLWLAGKLNLRDSEQDAAGIARRDDRIASASLLARGFARFGRDRLRGRVAIVQGLDILGASGTIAPLASRDDADGTFTKVEAWGDYQLSLGKRASLVVAAEAQLADQALLSSEEFGVGGRSFGRGFDYREVSGDRGAAASAELRFDLAKLPRPVRAAQLYVYGDAGVAGNRETGFGGGTLASAGGGIRLSTERLSGSFELGVPLKDANRPSSARDVRASFTLSARF